MRGALWLAGAALVLYVGVCGLLFVFQRTLLYLPQPARTVAPSIRLPVAGAELQVSVRPLPGAPALIYFGGNAEDVSGSLAELADAFPGHALYLMHYRGYGLSTGTPTEVALQADAKALYHHVASSHTGVTVMGRSLGSGLAIRLAAEQTVSRLILVTPYDSIEAVATRQFSWLPVRWLIRDRFDSAAVAPMVSVHTTVIVAEHDEVIRRERSDALLDRFAPGLVRLTVIPGAGHNDVSAYPAYVQALGSP